MNNKQISLLVFILFLFFTSCKTGDVHFQENIDQIITNSKIFDKNFTGLMVFDPLENKVVYNHNAHKYFNPASNTKLFTFYAALNILGDSIPSIQYSIREDSLLFKGMADPSFLNPDLYPTLKTFHFLKDSPQSLFFVPGKYPKARYGAGWAWDDFNNYYATEKADFPIYGNVVHFTFTGKSGAPKVNPTFFNENVSFNLEQISNIKRLVQREEFKNQFYYTFPVDTNTTTKAVPFIYSSDLMLELLTDTLSKPVHLLSNFNFTPEHTLFSMPVDSIYKRMLQQSDNFIAEHLLLMCAGKIADTLYTTIAIDYVKEHYLKDMPDELQWIDGSGLSRYNLFTPASIVNLLIKIKGLVPEDRLYKLMPSGGGSASLKEYTKTDKPYIYAKTGTLSNNHCLSGYLKCKSGKTLVFSFMNNNYIISESLIRDEMENVLFKIHENY